MHGPDRRPRRWRQHELMHHVYFRVCPRGHSGFPRSAVAARGHRWDPAQLPRQPGAGAGGGGVAGDAGVVRCAGCRTAGVPGLAARVSAVGID